MASIPYSPAYQHAYRHGVVPTAQQNQGIKDKQNSYAWFSPFGSLKHRVIGAMLRTVGGGKSYPLELMRHTGAGRPRRSRTLAAPSRTATSRTATGRGRTRRSSSGSTCGPIRPRPGRR
ncbi:hypothetical protein [Streptomyces sp. WM6378]|uniref:hypothetical protein n=1 Tax=Streptomyces sp. WM6378 TaxID=1415557 RepID=UPI00131E6565|nr:hypothetical protein [Streptomyces sp. WM6378]